MATPSENPNQPDKTPTPAGPDFPDIQTELVTVSEGEFSDSPGMRPDNSPAGDGEALGNNDGTNRDPAQTPESEIG